MTADYLRLHAIERPEAVALVDRGRAITYAGLDGDLRKLTGAVAELGVPRGGSVAVGTDDLYVHWLLLLAFEQLGIATASINPTDSVDASPWLAGVNLIMAEPQFPALAARPHHPITRDWLDRILARETKTDLDLARHSPEDPVRILRTSGTTGNQKRVLHPRSLHDAWVTRWITMAGLSRRTRLLLTMPFTVNGMYACATACLRAGGTVLSPAATELPNLADAIADRSISALILAPIQIARVLDALPAGFAKPPNFTIYSFGAAVSGSLRQRALERLATELVDMYGCNESGFISSTSSSRDDGLSTIWPDVQVEIVDDQDAPLPPGQVGRIRVKTPDMVQHYLGDPETTRRMFSDGWFYPGDLGMLHGSRQLQILGRGDNLLNFGGRKYAAETLELAILKQVPVDDVGLCSIPNADGVGELYVGLVGAPSDDRALLDSLRQALTHFRVGAFHTLRLSRIARNANGKIQRDALKKEIADALSVGLRSSPTAG